MADAAEILKLEQENKTNFERVSIDERVLSEIDNINNSRLSNGTIPESTLEGIRQNLFTASQEAAMPYAVTTTKHEFLEDKEIGLRTFTWLGKTAVQNAMSGYKFHSHPEAIKRVDIEVDEARNYTENLDIRIAKVFISPRMTRADASLQDARKEHLGDDDAIRVSWLESDDENNIKGRVMQSLLVKDIPFSAWTRMLSDENNIFGKSIELENDESALSVMKVHRQLEIPLDKLPNGPVDILESVVEYVEDQDLKIRLQNETKMYYKDQDKMTEVAEQKAEEWLAFEIELANSTINNKASYEIQRFINTLQDNWSNQDLQIIKDNYSPDGGYFMSRELAVVVESAWQNLLWSSAAIAVDSREVKEQINQDVLQKIAQNNELIAIAKSSGMEYGLLEAQTHRLIAGQKIDVGGNGCVGKNKSNFKSEAESNQINNDQNSSDESSEKIEFNKYGKCRVKSCGKVTYVGPCDVCRQCQAKFDEGHDPTKQVAKESISDKESNNKTFWEIINNSFGKQAEIELLEK